MIQAFLGIFNIVIFQPIYNALIWIYNTLPWQDFGIAIILLTIIIKLALISISKKQIESQKRMQEIQPRIKEIQKKYKDDKERQTKEVMAFYKKEKINPLAGCLPLIIQLIIFIAMYRVIIVIVENKFHIAADRLYAAVHNPEVLNTLSLGFIDLSTPNKGLAILAAAAMFYQSWMIIKKKKAGDDEKSEQQKEEKKKKEKNNDTPEAPDFASIMTKQMLYVGPLITLVIGFQFAAGLTLYWFTSILFTIAQQHYVQKKATTTK